MVYVPELDRQGFVDRQRINQERNRPTMTRKDAFLQGASPEGRNYATMMDLMSQSPGFESGDPRIDQLKQARRQYNRQDKYNIGEIMGQTPQFMNELYRTNSGVLREYANPTYNAMYPISEMLHRTTGSGGITGMLLNKAFGKTKEAGRGFYQDLRDMGIDILGSVGIGGAVPREEATEEVLQNYADQTFGYPYNVHEDEFTDTENWYDDRKDVVIPPMDDDFGDFYVDENTLASPYQEPVSFDDSGREYGIMLNQGLVTDPMEELRNRTLQDEYINYIESTGDRLTYDEFRGAWERTHALPRGLHQGEGHITPKWMRE